MARKITRHVPPPSQAVPLLPKGEGSSTISRQRVQDQGVQPGPQQGKHGGCSKSGCAEQGLGHLPSPDSHAEPHCERHQVSLGSRHPCGQHLCQNPTLWGHTEPQE